MSILSISALRQLSLSVMCVYCIETRKHFLKFFNERYYVMAFNFNFMNQNHVWQLFRALKINQLIATLKLQSNGPS